MRVEKVVPEPQQPDITITLTYEQAQLLKGVLSFFNRMANPLNIRGTGRTLAKVVHFNICLIDLLRVVGVVDYKE